LDSESKASRDTACSSSLQHQHTSCCPSGCQQCSFVLHCVKLDLKLRCCQ
jgi:hypothetical protein